MALLPLHKDPTLGSYPGNGVWKTGKQGLIAGASRQDQPTHVIVSRIGKR